MLTLNNSLFCCISFVQQQQILIMEWLPSTTNLKEEKFKELIISFASFVEVFKPKYILIDARKLDFIIDINLQEWYQKYIITKYIKVKVKKIAIVKTQNFVTNLSLEQTFDPDDSQGLCKRYFSDIKEAQTWIK